MNVPMAITADRHVSIRARRHYRPVPKTISKSRKEYAPVKCQLKGKEKDTSRLQIRPTRMLVQFDSSGVANNSRRIVKKAGLHHGTVSVATTAKLQPRSATGTRRVRNADADKHRHTRMAADRKTKCRKKRQHFFLKEVEKTPRFKVSRGLECL